MLRTLVVLLAAAAIAVPLSRRAGFGSVLGYLLAGVLIGPHGMGLITDLGQIESVSAFGVVMLLFLIGLELRPARLWVMRRTVLGFGAAQLLVSAAVLAGLASLAGIGWSGALVIGLGLALSSTAIVLPMLGERDLLGVRSGRDAFAVLLFQDIAFIPLVALTPLLASEMLPINLPWNRFAIGLGAVAAILLGGRYVLPRAFRLVGGARVPEVFTTLALLTVVGTAAIADYAGLSMSLGAFIAGVLFSESEFRHELQADIEPFEGLLLGFFFISVGMSANLPLAAQRPALIAAAVLALLAVKIVVLFAVARIGGRDTAQALRLAAALPQASEFSFVLFAAAVADGTLDRASAEAATLVVALSMAATPLLFAASERFLIPRLNVRQEPAYDAISGRAPVIICGFGRMGQVVGRVLRMQRIPFTALEGDAAQVEVVRQFGAQVFYGNPARPDVLRAAGAETARLLVVTLDKAEENLLVVEMARRHFPHLLIVARARNRRHAHLLMDRGIERIVRETFHSSLKLAEESLLALDLPRPHARQAVELFRLHDEKLLRDTHAIYQDDARMIQTAKQAAVELRELFEADQPAGAPLPSLGRVQ